MRLPNRGTKRPMLQAAQARMNNPWGWRARMRPQRGCCLVKDEGGDIVWKCPCPRHLTIAQPRLAPVPPTYFVAYR